MRHETQLALIRRVLDLVDRGTTDMVPGEYANPVERYLDPVRFERERDVLFRRLPLILGHASQWPNPGDFATHDATGIPILAVRGDDGRMRAFLNVCRHRGTRVVAGPCGQGAKSFVCPYHAWKYSLAGQLVGVPHRHGFPDLDPAASGLVELTCEERLGFVWVVPSPGPAIDVLDYLGPLADELESFGFDSHVVYDPRSFQRQLNWKLGFDIFLEGYHIRGTHDETIWPMFMDNVGLYDNFSPHLRNVFPKRSIVELRDVDRRQWNLREHANVLYTLFPNTGILIQPDHATVLHTFPTGPATTRIESYTLIPEPPETEKARRYWDANNAIFCAAIDEDYQMGESIQRGLAAGANRSLRFGRFEQALGYFHDAVERALDTAPGR